MALVLSYGFIFLEMVPHLCLHSGEQSVRSLSETIPTSPIKFCLIFLTMKVKYLNVAHNVAYSSGFAEVRFV